MVETSAPAVDVVPGVASGEENGKNEDRQGFGLGPDSPHRAGT